MRKMYLKSIRAQGFKSFADKLNLEINPGITGIVGPNGSGKSNIVDAVRWVLGEQSAKSLRSSAMSEVIFNGSNSREPLKRAMVALTFDNTDHYLNSDFAEIEVKRVVYATGENEYYLNNSKVRLKDITDLFIESGTGTGAFNIISQGNVTNIVNSKSSDRRLIFEATAGVLKYKKRKEESLQKLAKTEENLLRLNLVIQELETTVEPLQKQSAKAQQYVAIKEELESIDIALMAEDITKFNAEYRQNQADITLLKEQLTGKESTEAELTLEKLRAQNLSLEDQLTNKRNEILELTKKLSNLNNEKQLTIERQKYNVNEKALNENLLTLKEEQLVLEKNQELLQQDLTKLTKEIKAKEKEHRDLADETLKLKITHDNLEVKLQNKNKDLLVWQNKIEILENNLASEAASPLAVRSVVSNPRLKGIHSTIAKILTVPDEYLVAVDTALGAARNYIVVSDEDAAMKAINYLKENRLGRATFYPLNIIKAREIAPSLMPNIKKTPGFVGVLADLVKYDDIYENIVKNQLGNVLVVQDTTTLKTMGKLVDYKYKVVTLEGEIQNVGGSITGGVNKNSNAMLAKKELLQYKETYQNLQQEITVLNLEREKAAAKLQQLTDQDLNQTKDILIIETEIESKTTSLEDITKTLAQKTSELEGMKNLQNNKLNDKLTTLLEEISVLEKNKQTVENDVNDLMTTKADLTDEIAALTKQVKDLNTEYNRMQNELKDKEVAGGKIEVKLDNLLVLLNEEYNLTYEAALTNYSLDLDESLAREKVNRLKKDLQKIGEVNLGSIAEYERLNKRYEFLTKQRADLTQSSGELKDIITQMDAIMVEKFQTTFSEVKKEFSRIFKLMFKGGHGELKLSDPNDILHTGIDIIAIPPGKKINSPLALSGGEKALTAICLLFAMLEVRPAPFIILDEAEAALDEANVDMFGKYLNQEKDKSQFIVITHKKKMMEYADALYGITMQESGVSKIVSTKLTN